MMRSGGFLCSVRPRACVRVYESVSVQFAAMFAETLPVDNTKCCFRAVRVIVGVHTGIAAFYFGGAIMRLSVCTLSPLYC